MNIECRELAVSERYRVNAFYQLTTYKRAVSESDRVFVAEHSKAIMGAARIENRDDVQVLRGMYIHPQHVRSGIGRQLLCAMEPALARTDAYCIPRDHLFGFYAEAGFTCISADAAPVFLSERLDGYIKEGIQVAIMYRPKG